MTTQILIEKITQAKKIAEVLDPKDLKGSYRTAVKLLHPDVCALPQAATALIRLNELKAIFEHGKLYKDDAGEMRAKEKSVSFTGLPSLLKMSHANYRKLKNLNSEAASQFHRYLPKSLELGGDLIANFSHRAVPLSGLTLPQKHVNWILSRMLEVCSWMAQEGYVHCGINPESVFVVPETHGVILGSFYHMSLEDGRLRTISAKYKNWYAPEIFKEKRAITTIDIELCKRTAAYLLGDKSGVGVKLRKTHNRDFIDFLLNSHTDTFECYRDYRNLLKRNFDNKFHPLSL